MEKSSRKQICIWVYFIAQLLIFTAIKICEYAVGGKALCVVQYSAIILNTLAAVVVYLNCKNRIKDKHINLIFFGLMMTFCADFFLTLLEEPKIVGFAFFCAVELIYAFYLGFDKLGVILRCVIFAGLVIAMCCMKIFSWEKVVGVLNISLVTINMLYSWIGYKKKREKSDLIFAAAITLFFLGDFSIVIRTLTSGVLQSIFAFLVWTAYVPSQVLLLVTYYKKANQK